MTTIVNIEIDGIDLLCEIELNQEDNIDNGFKVIEVQLAGNDTNINSIIDKSIVYELIYEELKKEVLRQKYGKPISRKE